MIHPFIYVALYFVAYLFIISYVLGLLWNFTIPDIFNLKEITYWQAFRLNILCSILFGGIQLKGMMNL